MFFEMEKQAKKDAKALLAFLLTPTAKNAPAPIDPFELVLTEKQFEYMTNEELFACKGTQLIFDIECYVNYFLVAFKSVDTGKVLLFERREGLELPYNKIRWILDNCCVIGYYSKSYDMLMLRMAMIGHACGFLKQLSDKLIKPDETGKTMRVYELERLYKLPEETFDHIDLFEVAPLSGSLKLYAGRLHCTRMQDLPYAEDAVLTMEETITLAKYCVNDLDNTLLLLTELKQQMALRVAMSAQYGVDVRSKSDAQIAETVIASELFKITGKKAYRPDIAEGKIYFYNMPAFVKYEAPALNDLKALISAAQFRMNKAGSPEIPEEIEGHTVTINKTTYKIGIGGLHSCEESVCYRSDDEFVLIDRDVVSYYPSIILNQNLYPKHLSKTFLDVYRGIVQRRIHAKNTGDKVVADSLKITINGSFGKFGSKWSILYAPNLMLQVTITGQLALLMLIDKIENVGIQVVSANTDGVVIRCPRARRGELDAVITEWETETKFATEETTYRAIYSRDVNSYIAVKDDGKVKTKGAFSERGSAGDSRLSRNPENFVCLDAVIAHITEGTPIADTVNACTDVRRFVTVRQVKGGAAKSSVYLGKVIRWYFSTEMKGEINYVGSGNKVPNSDEAMPLMELTETLPHDLYRDKYIAKANEMLVDLGVTVELLLEAGNRLLL
jgi:hypothetical protein